MKEMNHTDLTKLEVEEEGFRICIEKSTSCDCSVTTQHSGMPTAMIQPNMPQFSYQVPFAAEAIQQQPANVSQVVTEKAEETTGKKILSPMVGTFYASSSPDKPAFVKVGDRVKKGQTLCIIEAMKLMNEIESEYDGEIVKILVDNEAMVEYGQPLYEIA